MDVQLDVGVINHSLKNLAIHLKADGPDRLGLPNHSTDRPPKGVKIYRALDPREQANLPVRAGMTRLVRQPYVQLFARQREGPLIKFHPSPPGFGPALQTRRV